MQPTEPTRRRWSKLAIACFVLGLLGLLLSVVSASLALICGVAALIKIRKAGGRLRGKGLAISGIALSIVFMLLFGLYLLWRLDAPPIENDYTIADLRSAPAEFDRSYELLLSLGEDDPDAVDGFPAIGLTSEDCDLLYRFRRESRETGEGYDNVRRALLSDPNGILRAWEDAQDGRDIIEQLSGGLTSEYIDLLTRPGRELRKTGNGYDDVRRFVLSDPNGILRAWQNARKGRDIIEQLSGFDEIADLTPPDLAVEFDYFGSLANLRRVYHFNVCLATEQGESEQAVRELIEFDNVFRKLIVNARSTMLQLVCYGGMFKDYKTASFVVNNPHASRESLDMLSMHFTPLSKEQWSWRNQCVFEYLSRRNLLDSTFEELILYKHVLLKRNSTVRVLRNHWDSWINCKEWRRGEYDPYQFSVWPELYPDCMPKVGFDGDLDPFETRRYRWYNPIGAMFLAMTVPSSRELFGPRNRLKIQEDLFRILLDKRLGKEVSLKALAYSQEYIVDVDKKIIYSPGEDGEPFTHDDIKLSINPEVIKFE